MFALLTCSGCVNHFLESQGSMVVATQFTKHRGQEIQGSTYKTTKAKQKRIKSDKFYWLLNVSEQFHEYQSLYLPGHLVR